MGNTKWGMEGPCPPFGTGAFIRHHTALGGPVAPLRAGQGGMWTGCPSLLAGQSLGTVEKVALQTSGHGAGALRPPTLPAPFYPAPSSLALCSGSAPTFSRPPHCGGRNSPYPLFPFQVSSRKLCLLPTTSLSGFNSLVRKTGNRSKHFLCIPATLIQDKMARKCGCWGMPGTTCQHFTWIQALGPIGGVGSRLHTCSCCSKGSPGVGVGLPVAPLEAPSPPSWSKERTKFWC